MELLVGTNNKGKVVEISEVLGDLPITLIRPETLSITEVPDETGKTFEENAIQKALHYHGLSSLPTVADDSGIIVEALQNELGIHTRRWGAGAQATDREWIDFFLDRMRREENRKARFICSLAYMDPEGVLHTYEGVCDGHITDQLEADYLPGLPISACFQPEGFDKVYSALSIAEKNTISHRGRAVHQFRTHLQEGL